MIHSTWQLFLVAWAGVSISVGLLLSLLDAPKPTKAGRPVYEDEGGW